MKYIILIFTLILSLSLEAQTPNLDPIGLINWLGQTGEYDPLFQKMLQKNCCDEQFSELILEVIDPALAHIESMQGQYDARIEELDDFLSKLETLIIQGNTQAAINLFKTVTSGYGGVKGILKIGEEAAGTAFNEYLFEESSKELRNKILGDLGVSLEAIAVQSNDKELQAIAKKYETNLKKLESLNYIEYALLTTAVILVAVKAAAAATITFVIYQTIGFTGNFSSAMNDVDFRNKLSKLLKDKRKLTQEYSIFFKTLTNDRNALFRQRQYLVNKCVPQLIK